MEPCMVFPPSLLLCIVLVVVSTIFYFFSFRISLFLIKKVIYEGTGASSGIATERDVYFCGKSKDDVFLGESLPSSLAGMTQLGS